MVGLLFGMCRSHHAVETRLHEQRNSRKKLQKEMKEVRKAIYHNKTPSPLGTEERESNPPTPFEQRYASYKHFDPSHPFAPYTSTTQMGFDSQLGGNFGQQGHSFDAPPPPLEQPRPSMTDQIAADIFGYPNPSMASSSHTSLPHTTLPSFFDSALYISQDLIGLHLMTMRLTTKMITRSQDIKLLRTPIFFFLDDY
jgi:hypothetical protein